jgi:hypothetical protein
VRKLTQITELISSAAPDLVGVQEILADPKGPRTTGVRGPPCQVGCRVERVPIPEARPSRHSVGWLARGQLSDPTEVAVYPHQVPATTIDDNGNQITATTAAKRGALAGHLRPR